jgi:hypothetical protein
MGGDPSNGRGRSDNALFRLPALAGIAFSCSWLIGLVILSSSTDVHSSGADVLQTYDGHRGVAMAQFVLTEGIPAIALVVVFWGLARSAAEAGEGEQGRRLLAIGLVAVGISFVQCLLGLYLVGRLVPDRRAGSASTLFEAINRLDGVKMLLLAGVAAMTFALVRRGGLPLPGWLAYVSAALALAISISGIGYLLLLSGPALAAWVSLPLLLIWVTATGIALARTGTPAADITHRLAPTP